MKAEDLDMETRYPKSDNGQIRWDLLRGRGFVKAYGQTKAVNNFDIHISKGEIVGLLGGNGAGKSTLTRIISGVTKPDQGTLWFDGQEIDFRQFSPSRANHLGIRIVYQELSLCLNLRVYENFFIELSRKFKKDFQWRRHATAISRKVLDDVFPDNHINANARLDTLSIAQRQMVEIARALSDEDLKLLILDEPTSSLASEQTEQLKSFIKRKATEGISFIFITHRLNEAISLVDRMYVASNGSCSWTGNVDETNENNLIVKMGGQLDQPTPSEICERNNLACEINPNVGVKVDGLRICKGEKISFDIYGGQIIGISGLEGNGQRELLHTLFANRKKNNKSIQFKGSVAYVTGDRKNEGNFHLWSILENMMINRLAFGKLFALNSEKRLITVAQKWYDKLKVKSEGFQAGITSLSGGNQQKILLARALVADADIIILDDPTRGVDIATKNDLYEIFWEASLAGKLVLWYSSDDAEFKHCNRVYVMRYHSVVAVLSEDEISKNTIVEASFKGEELKAVVEKSEIAEGSGSRIKSFFGTSVVVPFFAMMIVYFLCGVRSPAVFSVFGVELLLSGALPLIILTLGQMFIIGFSQIDLGAGFFMGLISVVAATTLTTSPGLGWLSILGLLIAYSSMGLAIYYRSIPAIVMTLGASFVWKGISISILNSPGGLAPEWLMNIFWSSFFVPPVIVVIILITAASWMFYRSKYGTVIKGFGNNAGALVRSGWSEALAHFITFFVAGVLALLGGLSMAGISTAADPTAGGSYTMLTIASVIIGGGYLTGGFVTVPGAVFGAITFSLISSLLGFLNVSTDFTAAVQGLILILILSLRLMAKGRKT